METPQPNSLVASLPHGHEASFHALFQASIDAVLLTKPDGSILNANPAACRMFKCSEQDLVRLGRKGVVDVNDPRLTVALAERERTSRFYGELTLIRADGERFPGEVSSAVFRGGDGELRTSMVIRDISERSRVEAALRESERNYRTVVEDQTEIISRYREDGTLTFVNDVYCHVFGKTKDELLGRRWQPMALPEELPSIERQLARLCAANPVVVIENQARVGNGEIRWMQFVNRGFFDASGRVVEIQAVGRDITERRLVEAELQVSKESLRALAGRLQEVRELERANLAREIHDVLAQELTRLKIDLVWIRHRLERQPQRAEETALVGRVSGLERMTDSIIAQVQRIATGLRPAVLDSLGLCAAVEWQVQEFQKHSGIKCQLEIQESDSPIGSAAATAAFRILQESLTNVQRHAQASLVKISLKQEVERLRLCIQDNGRGMPAAVIGSPLSIGLVGMRERASLLGGQIEIRSAPGGGTQVETLLPLGGQLTFPP